MLITHNILFYPRSIDSVPESGIICRNVFGLSVSVPWLRKKVRLTAGSERCVLRGVGVRGRHTAARETSESVTRTCRVERTNVAKRKSGEKNGTVALIRRTWIIINGPRIYEKLSPLNEVDLTKFPTRLRQRQRLTQSVLTFLFDSSVTLEMSSCVSQRHHHFFFFAFYSHLLERFSPQNKLRQKWHVHFLRRCVHWQF